MFRSRPKRPTHTTSIRRITVVPSTPLDEHDTAHNSSSAASSPRLLHQLLTSTVAQAAGQRYQQLHHTICDHLKEHVPSLDVQSRPGQYIVHSALLSCALVLVYAFLATAFDLTHHVIYSPLQLQLLYLSPNRCVPHLQVADLTTDSPDAAASYQPAGFTACRSRVETANTALIAILPATYTYLHIADDLTSSALHSSLVVDSLLQSISNWHQYVADEVMLVIDNAQLCQHVKQTLGVNCITSEICQHVETANERHLCLFDTIYRQLDAEYFVITSVSTQYDHRTLPVLNTLAQSLDQFVAVADVYTDGYTALPAGEGSAALFLSSQTFSELLSSMEQAETSPFSLLQALTVTSAPTSLVDVSSALKLHTSRQVLHTSSTSTASTWSQWLRLPADMCHVRYSSDDGVLTLTLCQRHSVQQQLQQAVVGSSILLVEVTEATMTVVHNFRCNMIDLAMEAQTDLPMLLMPTSAAVAKQLHDAGWSESIAEWPSSAEQPPSTQAYKLQQQLQQASIVIAALSQGTNVLLTTLQTLWLRSPMHILQQSTCDMTMHTYVNNQPTNGLTVLRASDATLQYAITVHSCLQHRLDFVSLHGADQLRFPYDADADCRHWVASTMQAQQHLTYCNANTHQAALSCDFFQSPNPLHQQGASPSVIVFPTYNFTLSAMLGTLQRWQYLFVQADNINSHAIAASNEMTCLSLSSSRLAPLLQAELALGSDSSPLAAQPALRIHFFLLVDTRTEDLQALVQQCSTLVDSLVPEFPVLQASLHLTIPLQSASASAKSRLVAQRSSLIQHARAVEWKHGHYHLQLFEQLVTTTEQWLYLVQHEIDADAAAYGPASLVHLLRSGHRMSLEPSSIHGLQTSLAAFVNADNIISSVAGLQLRSSAAGSACNASTSIMYDASLDTVLWSFPAFTALARWSQYMALLNDAAYTDCMPANLLSSDQSQHLVQRFLLETGRQLLTPAADGRCMLTQRVDAPSQQASWKWLPPFAPTNSTEEQTSALSSFCSYANSTVVATVNDEMRRYDTEYNLTHTSSSALSDHYLKIYTLLSADIGDFVHQNPLAAIRSPEVRFAVYQPVKPAPFDRHLRGIYFTFLFAVLTQRILLIDLPDFHLQFSVPTEWPGVKWRLEDYRVLFDLHKPTHTYIRLNDTYDSMLVQDLNHELYNSVFTIHGEMTSHDRALQQNPRYSGLLEALFGTHSRMRRVAAIMELLLSNPTPLLLHTTERALNAVHQQRHQKAGNVTSFAVQAHASTADDLLPSVTTSASSERLIVVHANVMPRHFPTVSTAADPLPGIDDSYWHCLKHWLMQLSASGSHTTIVFLSNKMNEHAYRLAESQLAPFGVVVTVPELYYQPERLNDASRVYGPTSSNHLSNSCTMKRTDASSQPVCELDLHLGMGYLLSLADAVLMTETTSAQFFPAAAGYRQPAYVIRVAEPEKRDPKSNELMAEAEQAYCGTLHRQDQLITSDLLF